MRVVVTYVRELVAKDRLLNIGALELEAARDPDFIARVIVVGALLLGYVIADQLLPGQPRPLRLSQGLLSWDGDWYRDIVAYGYDKVGQTSLRFFPLFPLVSIAVRVVVRTPLGHEAILNDLEAGD